MLRRSVSAAFCCLGRILAINWQTEETKRPLRGASPNIYIHTHTGLLETDRQQRIEPHITAASNCVWFKNHDLLLRPNLYFLLGYLKKQSGASLYFYFCMYRQTITGNSSYKHVCASAASFIYFMRLIKLHCCLKTTEHPLICQFGDSICCCYLGFFFGNRRVRCESRARKDDGMTLVMRTHTKP